MKTSLLAISFLISVSLKVDGQTQPTFPLSVMLETTDGTTINSSTFVHEEKLLVLDFWIHGCGPCIMAFNTIRDNFSEWNARTGTKIIAIAAQKRDEKILELIKKSNWPFEVYFDPEFKLDKATARTYDHGQIELGFPNMYVFNHNYEIIGKLYGSKEKLIDGVRPPTDGEPMIGRMEDYFEVDMDQYYYFFKGMQEKAR